MVSQALPISSALPPSDGPPMTAEQYLASVRHEANTLPSVITAHADASVEAMYGSQSSPAVLPRTRGVAPAPPHAAPSVHWRCKVAASFGELQEALANLPALQLNGSKGVPSACDQWHSHFVAHLPSLSFLRRLDFLTIVKALAALDRAIPFDETAALHTLRDSYLPIWTFSLLAFVYPYVLCFSCHPAQPILPIDPLTSPPCSLFVCRPLDADTAAIIRSLLQKAALARSVIVSLTSHLTHALSFLEPMLFFADILQLNNCSS